MWCDTLLRVNDGMFYLLFSDIKERHENKLSKLW
jgi:hypothetical protein